MRLLRRIAREQRGAMAVAVGLMLPALLAFGVIAVDVGNWYVHKRELQTQADAGALAGAAYFKYPCVDAPIAAAAQSYAGTDHNKFTNVPAANSTFLLNASNFSGQSKPGDSGLTGSPCADDAVDVKMTERNASGIFGSFLAPFINAQARVSIQRLDQAKGLLPIGVPIPDPKRVRVTFISEVTGEVLGSQDLCKETNPVSGMQIWDNTSANATGWNTATSSCDTSTLPSSVPLTFNDPKYAKVGVRVQISGSTANISCGQQGVTCYDAGSANGAAFVHGWSDQPAVTNAGNSAPQARSVILLPGTCGDAYFSALSSACTIGLRAKVDFQPREYDATGNPKSSVSVKATVTGSSGSSSYNLSWDPTSQTWQTSSINVPPAAGPLNITLTWSQTDNTVGTQTCKSGSNACTGTTDVVQRTFSASSASSGPIQLLQVGDTANTSGVNDVQMCSTAHPSCTENFAVRVGIGGTLALSKPTDPPTLLRVADGSQTQAIDCDPQVSNLKAEIAQGCGPQYGRNTGQACPDHTQSATQAQGATWYCVWTQTGSSNQVADGMNLRVNGGSTTCTAPNHWPNYQPGDPRIIPVFVVPYGSFAGSGNASFPIQDFAFFYVTGWSGSGGHADLCANQGDEIPPNNGDLYGHFIKYTTVNNSGGSGTPCDLSSLSGCTAVMTK